MPPRPDLPWGHRHRSREPHRRLQSLPPRPTRRRPRSPDRSPAALLGVPPGKVPPARVHLRGVAALRCSKLLGPPVRKWAGEELGASPAGHSDQGNCYLLSRSWSSSSTISASSTTSPSGLPLGPPASAAPCCCWACW